MISGRQSHPVPREDADQSSTLSLWENQGVLVPHKGDQKKNRIGIQCEPDTEFKVAPSYSKKRQMDEIRCNHASNSRSKMSLPHVIKTKD